MADTWFTQQETSKTAPNTKAETASGTRINPGPYIGIVKNVVDPTYSGTINVYIPELGGDPNDAASWKKMMYATPFYGRTNIQDNKTYDGSPHSYGMWFVAPDVGGSVLCIFADGKSDKGYWFACVPEWPSLHMVPSIGARVDGGGVDPVVEHYDSGDDPKRLANPRTLPKFVHEEQKKIWTKQGLIQDSDRGPGTSSAFRETPSAVFGISTPGRPIHKDDPQLQADPLNPGSEIYGVKGRKGGHTLIMDDGDSDGNNQMFRLRSAAGHMILMNDTKEFIYIINSQGTAWIEMDAKGAISIFSQSQMNVTAKDGFSLETQGSLKMKGKTVDIIAENGLNIGAADINVLASGSTKITGKQSLHLLSKKNTYLTGEACIQIKSDGHIDADSSCHTINTAGATKAEEAGEAKKPENMPSNEPRNKNASSLTSSPTANTKNNAATNPNNPYGQANGFGSGGAQQNYGPQTNNVQPVVYNSGPQGSLQGQGSVYGGYRPDNYNGSGIDWTVAGTIAGAIAGIAFAGGSSYNVTGDNDPKLSVGESQNNPGNLPYNDSDKFAVGYNNNLAVYAKPENGIAALAVAFDALNTNVSTRSIDIIQGFLNAKSNVDPKVIDMTRYMHNNLGIVADDYVALYDPNTRIGWIAYAIQYIQGRLIYSYDQVVTGCAMSLGISVTDFLMGIQPLTKPWQNNNGYNPLSGFVNPAQNNSIVQNGSSPLQTIGSAITGGLIGGLIGNLFDSAQQQKQNSTTQQGEIIQVSSVAAARRYLESNPNTPSGTVFAYPDGSTWSLGGGNQSITSPIPGIVDTGVSYGNGQCAALAQSNITNFGQMKDVQYGGSVLGNNTIPPGTIIVTGNYKNADGSLAYGPSNQPGGVSGKSHLAAYLGQGSDDRGRYIVVQDQWAGRPCGVRKIYENTGDEGADKFYVAKSAANGYDSNGVRLPNSDNYNPNATVPSIASGNPTPATNSQYIAPIEADEARDMKSTTSRTVLNPNDAYGDTIANPADSAISRTYDPRTGEVVTKYAVTGPTLPAGANPGDIATGGYGAPTPNTDFYPEDYRDIANRSTKDYNLMYDPRTNDVIQVEKPTYSNYYTYDESHPPSSAVYNAYDDPTNTELKKFSSAATTFDRDYVGSTGRQNAPVPDYGPAASSGRQNLPINSEYAGEKNAEEYVKAQAAEANRPTLAYDPRTGEVVDANSITGNKKSIGTLNAVRPEVDPSTGKIGNQPITGAKQAPGTGGANGGQKTPQGSSQTGAGGKSC